jgi:hypothetical protein
MRGSSALFAITAVLSGLVIGLLSLALTLKLVAENTSIQNGAWFHNPYVGSNAASGYTRATIAIIGFLGMTREESIYFVARTDDNDETLSGFCTYKVDGRFLDNDARWWSITVYDALTSKLVPNEQYRYSFNGDNLLLNEDGSFTLWISPNEQAGNWIPVQEDRQFDLTLRMYNPSSDAGDFPETIGLPSISKEDCL